MTGISAWLIAKFGEKAVRRYGPWVIVGLVFLLVAGTYFAAYSVGRSHGKAKWQGKYNTANETAQHNADEVAKLTAALKRHDDAETTRRAEYDRRLAEIHEAYEAALQRQATVNQRALEDARRTTADLRERLAELTVAEACHAAWVEVAK